MACPGLFLAFTRAVGDIGALATVGDVVLEVIELVLALEAVLGQTWAEQYARVGRFVDDKLAGLDVCLGLDVEALLDAVLDTDVLGGAFDASVAAVVGDGVGDGYVRVQVLLYPVVYL